jgi:hypothetical protein
MPFVGLAFHSEFQQVVCPPLRFLRSVDAVICKHCSRCAVNFLLVLATPCHGPLPMGTRSTHSENHGANRNMTTLLQRVPIGLREPSATDTTVLINSTCM